MANRLSYLTHARGVLALGLPLAGSHIAGFLVHVTDTVMMGWYGVEELAAVVLGGSFWFILFIMGSGFSAGIQGLIPTEIARGDERQVRRLTRMAIWLTLIYAALVTPIYLFAEAILLALGQDPEVAHLAGLYLVIAGWSVIPSLLLNTMRVYLSALNRAGVVLVVTITGFVVHAFANWVLIFGNLGAPEMGIQGAAVSTLITDAVMLAILLGFALRKFPQHALLRRFWVADWEAFRRVFALGWPIGLQLLAEVGLFTGVAILMGWISPVALAAHGIALQLAAFTFLIHLGMSNAATIRVGEALGRGDRDNLRRGALTGVAMSILLALASCAVFFSFAEPLLRLFLDPTDPQTDAVVAAGIVLVWIAALFQLADGGQAMAIGLLRGLADTRVPMLIAVFGYWCVGLPVAWWLGIGAGWGGPGVWTGLVIALVVVWVACSWRFWAVMLRRAVPASAAAAAGATPAGAP